MRSPPPRISNLLVRVYVEERGGGGGWVGGRGEYVDFPDLDNASILMVTNWGMVNYQCILFY